MHRHMIQFWINFVFFLIFWKNTFINSSEAGWCFLVIFCVFLLNSNSQWIRWSFFAIFGGFWSSFFALINDHLVPVGPAGIMVLDRSWRTAEGPSARFRSFSCPRWTCSANQLWLEKIHIKNQPFRNAESEWSGVCWT